MLFSLHGVHVPHRKNTSGMSPIHLNSPNKVVIPMSMHIGAPAKPIVKLGDEVKIGTLIGEQNGFISSPVYSSISGKVTRVDNITLSNGALCPAVTIESDGLMAEDENITLPEYNTLPDFVSALKKSGIVGLGGAGFPTYVKFNIDDTDKATHLIVNGAECEPYITSDSIVMCEKADDILFALKAIKKLFPKIKIIIGIEKNKPEAIAKMREMAEKIADTEVKVLSSMYPQGGEKVLVYHTTGKIIKKGKLPLDSGCIVSNSTTIASIGAYLQTGMPLIKKCITVDGSAVKEPKNVIAPIGTLISDLIDFAGGLKCDAGKVLYGGPMMGIAIPSTELPVMKNTNAIIALNEKDAYLGCETACIHCGTCISNCPMGISSCSISKAYKERDAASLEKLGIEVCMECGCCSFGCPANRRLVETNRLAKAFLREEKAKEAKK